MLKFKVTGEITVSPLKTSEQEFTEGLSKAINQWLRSNVCNYKGAVDIELVGDTDEIVAQFVTEDNKWQENLRNRL
jgi:hypothetical protein